MAGAGGGEGGRGETSLFPKDSATLPQTINDLLLKAQRESLNPVPPHLRNPRKQVSPIPLISNDSRVYCSAHKTRLPSYKDSMLM